MAGIGEAGKGGVSGSEVSRKSDPPTQEHQSLSVTTRFSGGHGFSRATKPT